MDYITNKIDTTNKLSNTPETTEHIVIQSSNIIQTTQIEKIEANTTKLEKTNDIVYTTQKENNHIETTNIQNNSEIIEETNILKNEYTSLVLLGFSSFNDFKSYFSFYVHFISIIKYISSKYLSFPVIINYNRNMRTLKQVEADCTLDSITSSENYKYLCIVNEDTTNIKNISVSPEFKFSSPNINVIGISPFAIIFMDNLQSIDKEIEIYLNKNIYILDNSTLSSDEKLDFNISGVINGSQPMLENENITFRSNIKDEKLSTEFNCIINNITYNNYLLKCKINESLNLDLQSAIAFVDNDDILLFNFYNNSDLIIRPKDNINNYGNRFFFKNRSKGLSPGIIAAIIIILVFVILATIFAIYYFRRKNVAIKNNIEDSTISKFKNYIA